MKKVTIELTDEQVKQLEDFMSGYAVKSVVRECSFQCSLFCLDVVLQNELFTSPTDVRDFLETLFRKIIA